MKFDPGAVVINRITKKSGSGWTRRPLYAHMRNPPQQGADAPIHVGAKIRALRKSMDMTIEDLSARTNLSIGHISQIERDISSPTLTALQTLASVLQVNISFFFSDIGENEVTEKYITRVDDRRYLSFASGMQECQLHTPEVKNLQVLLSSFEPGTSLEDAYTHDEEECGIVVAGVFEIVIDGESFLLNEGDSFSFPSTKPHRYSNPGETRAVVIWAMTPPSY